MIDAPTVIAFIALAVSLIAFIGTAIVATPRGKQFHTTPNGVRFTLDRETSIGSGEIRTSVNVETQSMDDMLRFIDEMDELEELDHLPWFMRGGEARQPEDSTKGKST